MTRHTGVCGNFPRGAGEKDDLRFADKQPDGIVVEGKRAYTDDDVTEATVYVQAKDFGAWGHLKASAPKLFLKAIYKPTNTYVLTIPRDDDGNHIADAWEGSALEPSSDDQEVAGQTARGDGLTVGSEYRGSCRVGERLEGTQAAQSETQGIVCSRRRRDIRYGCLGARERHRRLQGG
ncbi:MAG: hypothetical protein QM757_36240 [Paludibaculum sp.]